MKGTWTSRWDNEATDDVIYEDGVFTLRVPPGLGSNISICHKAALKAAVDAEREACAKIALEYDDSQYAFSGSIVDARERISAAIRARTNEDTL